MALCVTTHLHAGALTATTKKTRPLQQQRICYPTPVRVRGRCNQL